jgi:DNA modification methylase
MNDRPHGGASPELDCAAVAVAALEARDVILCGDVLEQLATLPDESVQCVVTSPPYWGLRDYGVAGQIGLEPVFGEYVEKMVAVFREVRRVLKPDGVLWLNLGDSYCPENRGENAKPRAHESYARNLQGDHMAADLPTRREVIAGMKESGVKRKDLIGMPWRVAFALQADGWWLRQDIIWHKPNPMPESVRDRCTKAHEYVFLLSKSERYFYDADAIAEAAVGPAGGNTKPNRSFDYDPVKHRTKAGLAASQERARQAGGFEIRNRRSVWSITSEPYPEAHFATFPTELPRICILAGSRLGDTVLDPFAGSGTTLQVATELGRESIGIELNPAYADLIRRRLASTTIGLPLETAA